VDSDDSGDRDRREGTLVLQAFFKVHTITLLNAMGVLAAYGGLGTDRRVSHVVLAEVILVAFKRTAELAQGRRPAAWLLEIAARLILERGPSLVSEEDLALAREIDDAAANKAAQDIKYADAAMARLRDLAASGWKENQQLIEEIGRLLRPLDHEQRRTILAGLQDGFHPDALALALGTTPEDAYTRLFEAVRQLRNK
jgi:DNA-directed RNA polymerase specialized sigma24 family protein